MDYSKFLIIQLRVIVDKGGETMRVKVRSV